MQALGAVYQLSQQVELQPSSHGAVKVALSVGLRGSFDCTQCTDPQKIERGYCPFLKDAEKATIPTFISETGDEKIDALWACPQGVAIRNPGLWQTLRTFFAVQAASPLGYYGEGLVQLAPRVSETYSNLNTTERRFESQIRKTRAEMDRRG